MRLDIKTLIQKHLIPAFNKPVIIASVALAYYLCLPYPVSFVKSICFLIAILYNVHFTIFNQWLSTHKIFSLILQPPDHLAAFRVISAPAEQVAGAEQAAHGEHIGDYFNHYIQHLTGF